MRLNARRLVRCMVVDMHYRIRRPGSQDFIDRPLECDALLGVGVSPTTHAPQRVITLDDDEAKQVLASAIAGEGISLDGPSVWLGGRQYRLYRACFGWR